MGQTVYKVCPATDWAAAMHAGAYAGSPDDRRDGFIHLSTAEQLAGTLARHFSGRADLVLVGFDMDEIGPSLRFEASRKGELFPHVYGTLDPALARSTRPLTVAADGSHILPRDL